MLHELRITDFAIIDEISLTLGPGFLVITGETGAGKSIIVDAVNLLLGDRADPTMIRSGADRATVEGAFRVEPHLRARLRTILTEAGVEDELPADGPDEIVLYREVRTTGRSQARVNGTMVNLTVYGEIGGLLVDIHGQSEHLSLFKPARHLHLLDRYAGLDAQREAFKDLVHELSVIRGEIDGLLSDEAALARRVDMLQYQVQEIRVADPRPDEEATLDQERNRLVNAERLAQLAAEVQFAFDGDLAEIPGAEDLLAQVALAVANLAKLDPALAEYAQMADELSTQATELNSAIRQYHDDIEFDPQRLNEIEERVETLTRLKRKYGGTIEDVLAFAANAEAELETITNSEERLAALRDQEDRLLRQLGERGAALSQDRQAAAQRLSAALITELSDLRMDKTRFEVRIEQTDDPTGCYVDDRRLAFTPTGIDRIEFYLAANPGEPLRPLAKVASGGEAARIMLALKSVLTYADEVATLIFDEVDQGIGGRLGAVVGQKLWRLSDNHQVLVVTHLAQLAGFGDMHLRVTKHIQDERTVTHVAPLDDRGRVEEMAAMLGAETDSARQSAFDILILARRTKDSHREGEHLETA